MKTTRRGFMGLLVAGVSGIVASKAVAKVEQIGEKEGRYPLLYTNHEGGKWKQWPGDTPVTDTELSQRADINILIGGNIVHSLRFWERKGEFVGWRRWDCVNGWNRVTESVSSMRSTDTPGNQTVLDRMTEDGLKHVKWKKARGAK